MTEVSEVAGGYHGLSRKVLDYSLLMKRLVDEAKQPGFSPARWAPLAAMVATGRFRRVGNFMEVMNWDEYVGFLTPWARAAEWECSFRRITESGRTVFLELEERSVTGGVRSVVNSLSVYEFGGDGLLEHLDIYLQMPMPGAEMMQHYAGVDTGGGASAG